MKKIINLVYDKWEDNKPIPNGLIYYPNGSMISDGDCVINHCRMCSQKNELDIKKLPLSSIVDSPNEKFYYIINHHVPCSYIMNYVQKNNNEFSYEENQFEVITDEIKDYLRKYDNFYIMFITEHEPVFEDEFIKIVNYFELNGINTSKLFLLNNNYKMEEYKLTHNLNVNTYKTNYLQNCKIKDFMKMGESRYVTDKKGKFFMTFNKSLKAHRVVLLSLLLRSELIDDVNWSFVPNKNQKFGKGFISSVTDEEFLDQIEFLEKNTFKLSDLESKIYGENEERNQIIQTLTDFEHNETYEFSYVNITTESNYDYHENTVHVSEKSYKPFYFYQLPIFVASQHHIKIMKERYGFDFFDDIIDHSYDNEPNHKKRLKMIFDEIVRLHSNKDKVIDFYVNNEERFEENKRKTVELLKLINNDYNFFKSLV
jgi:hypothetical protein